MASNCQLRRLIRSLCTQALLHELTSARAEPVSQWSKECREARLLSILELKIQLPMDAGNMCLRGRSRLRNETFQYPIHQPKRCTHVTCTYIPINHASHNKISHDPTMSPSNGIQHTAAPKVHNDTTFRSYSPGQALEYAQSRGGYPQALIDEILNLHTQTGGSLDSLLDLGCGPGNATRALAAHFNHATGVDPSAEMIAAAKAVGGRSKSGTISFVQGEAETCAGIPDASIDLITAATSAHWFDMDSFWHTAARVLKPGGTVAIFTIWRTWCHPATTPRAGEVHAVLLELEQGTLGPFQREGNWSLMGLYRDLKMPWQLDQLCAEFAEEGYRRQVWNEDGRAGEDGTFFCGEEVRSLEDVERGIATISAVTRWREAHPEIANTEEDCVRAAFGRIGEILRLEGVRELVMVGPTVLVTLKRS